MKSRVRNTNTKNLNINLGVHFVSLYCIITNALFIARLISACDMEDTAFLMLPPLPLIVVIAVINTHIISSHSPHIKIILWVQIYQQEGHSRVHILLLLRALLKYLTLRSSGGWC
jgi:hypothetical protein